MANKGRWMPDGSIRRSQLVTTAGPGAVVDLVDHAVIIKGLDEWRYEDSKDGFIPEPRLEQQALARLRYSPDWKHHSVRLRLPPRCEDDIERQGPWRGVHARRFPSWYLCRGCKALVRRTDDSDVHTCHSGPKARGKLVPIRFVGGCPHGHIQDLYWRAFVHRGQIENEDSEDEEHPRPEKPFFCHIDEEKGRMSTEKGERYTSDLAILSSGTSGELSDLYVLCRRCGATRSLQDLRQPNALGGCQAWRPWLPHNDESCDEKLKLLIRTGSNVWFPQRLSVLSIPDSSDKVKKLVSKHWDSLQDVETTRDLTLLFSLVRALSRAFQDFEPGDVLDAIRAKRTGADKKLAPIREAEWKELMTAEWGYDHDLPPKGETWFARRLDIELPKFLDRVVLVHALREVRAMVGFTRIESAPQGPEGEVDPSMSLAPMSEGADWIPAVEVLGEGVFLAFNEAEVRKWEKRDAVQKREEQFRDALRAENQLAASDGSMDRFSSARLIMLHSLAHMLITQISLECGYSASAIRERIYCFRHPEDPSLSRAGILLYTGTPGSEGTLGGLVEVGREVVRHLKLALERNRICSNDPVCAQHAPDGPEDGRRREGAACHGCLLIAESSCERMNRDLDRALVVETLEGEDAAFLGGWG